MTDQSLLDELVRAAEELFDSKLRVPLERSHPDEFVAIEPVSGDYFLGKTLSEAQGAALDAHPDRLSHVMRVNHKTAVHFGVILR